MSQSIGSSFSFWAMPPNIEDILTTEKLPTSSVSCSTVLLSSLCWAFLYCLSYLAAGGKKTLFSGMVHCIPLLHGVIVTVLSWKAINDRPHPFLESGESNTPLHNLVMVISVGFFIYDFVYILLSKSEPTIMVIHHVFGVIVIGGGLITQEGGAEMITGSNQGIGFEIVKNLCQQFPGVVYLTSRDVAKGKAAVEALQKLSLIAEYHQLDVLDKESIAKLAEFIKDKHGGIDVLVNNAAIAYQEASPEPFGEQAETCLATNYFGLLHVCEALFPLLQPHARVVNMSSSEGHLSKIPGQNIRERLIDASLTIEGLTTLVKEFIESAKDGTYNETGWGRSSYRVSKNAVNALTAIQQRGFDCDPRSDIVVNSVHPGFCWTNMTRYRGILSPQQGAEAPTYLALLPPNVVQPRGQFVWKDKSIISWVEPLKERF